MSFTSQLFSLYFLDKSPRHVYKTNPWNKHVWGLIPYLSIPYISKAPICSNWWKPRYIALYPCQVLARCKCLLIGSPSNSPMYGLLKVTMPHVLRTSFNLLEVSLFQGKHIWVDSLQLTHILCSTVWVKTGACAIASLSFFGVLVRATFQSSIRLLNPIQVVASQQRWSKPGLPSHGLSWFHENYPLVN